MSLITAEGLDDMEQGSLDLRRYFTDASIGGSDGSAIAQNEGRFGVGSNGFQLGLSSSGFAQKVFDPAGTISPLTIICGFAFIQEDTAGRGSLARVDNSLGETVLTISLSALQQIQIFDATGALIFTDLANFVTSGVWHFIEFRLTTGDPGQLEVRLDQGPDDSDALFDGSGDFEDTPFTPLWRLHWAGTGNESRIDDIHILDTSGSFNNDFLGDGRIHSLRPTSDVTPNQMVPSTGVDHFAVVNENPATGANPELEFLTTDIIATERFSLENLPAGTDRVQFALVNGKALKDSGNRDLVLQAVSGVSLSSEQFTILTDYLYYQHGMDVDPATSVGWTRAAIDALLGGLASA